jgi:hypothetical protein
VAVGRWPGSTSAQFDVINSLSFGILQNPLHWQWWPRTLKSPPPINAFGIFVPLWPFGLAAALTAILLYRRRRALPEHHCLSCGYDLHGSPGPRCPECGAPFVADGPTRAQ